LWVGDVGQNNREEINIVDSGGNYGWPFFEGNRCNTEAPVPDCNFIALPPVIDYPRETGRSVTGGFVYRGSAIPDLMGVYLYADFVSGSVFQYFDPGAGTVIESQLETRLRISSFGQAVDGELYLLDRAGGGIHKIVAR
jgi:glucose/arabinose dehydrogenase